MNGEINFIFLYVNKKAALEQTTGPKLFFIGARRILFLTLPILKFQTCQNDFKFQNIILCTKPLNNVTNMSSIMIYDRSSSTKSSNYISSYSLKKEKINLEEINEIDEDEDAMKIRKLNNDIDDKRSKLIITILSMHELPIDQNDIEPQSKYNLQSIINFSSYSL